jgi:hypothetical protein
MHTTSTRTIASRLFGAVALLSLAACADGSPTGTVDAPALRRGADNVGSQSGGGTVSADRMIISLTRPTGAPFGNAKGKAKYSNRGGERELEIEAENIPAGTAVSFVLDGAVIGTGTANTLREVELNLNSDLGATVPSSVAGKTVSVRTAAGAVIVSGSF